MLMEDGELERRGIFYAFKMESFLYLEVLKAFLVCKTTIE